MPLKNCPDELVLAAFVDRMLPPAELERWREHLALCPECRRCVAEVVADRRTPRDRTMPDIPTAVRERVRGLVPGTGAGATPRLQVVPGGRGAAPDDDAAAEGDAAPPESRPMTPLRVRPGRPMTGPRWLLLAAAGVVLVLGLRGLGIPVFRGPAGQESSEMRGGDEMAFATLYPGNRAVLAITSPQALELVWRALPGSVIEQSGRGGVDHYEVTILDASGRPIWSTTTRETRLHVAPNAPLEAGHTYSWTVTAHLELGTSISTRTATFSLSR